MKYSEMKQEEQEEIASRYSLPVEALIAYEELGIEGDGEFENIEEAYNGQYSSDEDFARDMAEQRGDLPEAGSSAWPLYCIDWEWAARELMYDYSEQDGFYFRNM